MSDHGTCVTSASIEPARTAGQQSRDRSAGPAAGVPLSEDTRLAVEIRGLVERGTMDEARERFAGLVAAHQRRALRASRISTCATPPRPTKRCRTRSSRSSPTSGRIARRGRSRYGSRAFSSTDAWTGARRAPGGIAGSWRPRMNRRRMMQASDGRRHRRTESGARLLAQRTPRHAGSRDRPARWPSADGLHAVPLRRLHAAGGQRDDRPQRIDRPGPSVPRRP